MKPKAIDEYGSARDMVRAGSRLLEEHEARVKSLQDALIAGENSGQLKSLDHERFLQKLMNTSIVKIHSPLMSH